MANSAIRRAALAVVVTASLALIAGLATPVHAQVSPEEHASHHPGEAGGADPSTETPATDPVESGPVTGDGGMADQQSDKGGMGGGGGMMGGGGGGMGKMMEKKGAAAPKQLYPTLMALPDMPLEQRQEVQQQAHARMKAGAALMSEGLQALSRTAPSDDFAAMQDASATLREGLSQFDSGLAAHRALAEGKAPRNVALTWFKREMNLLAPGPGQVYRGPLGLSWLHFFTMLILSLFAAAMIAMYFFKMRRAAALLGRIAAVSPRESAAPATDGVAASMESTADSPRRTSIDTGQAAPDDCCGGGGGDCASEAIPAVPGTSHGLLAIAERKLCRLRVARIAQETPDVKTFRLVACHGGSIPFSYLPGQFLTLTLPVDEKPIRRSYTISSAPTQGYYCEITVKREEQGAGSRFLHDKLTVGDTLEVKAPSGKFLFTGQEADSIVLIGGGVGITPMMSIARALTDMAWQGDIYFIAACQDPEHFIFESELEQLEARYANLHLFVAMSRIEADIGKYRSGRLSKDLLAEWIPDLKEKWVQLCGAPAMMDATSEMLKELGVLEADIHTENFGSTQKPKAKVAEGQEAAQNAREKEHGIVLSFAKSNVSTELLPDETVLEASERADVNIDYSCRVGSCGECKVKLLSGTVVMEEESGLDPGEKESGIILACQAKCSGNISVDA